jgi:transcriptional regulator with XRE-family HTH domain
MSAAVDSLPTQHLHPLAAFRERRGMGLAILAARAQTSQTTLWRVEQGQHNNLNIQLIGRLAAATGNRVSAAVIFDWHYRRLRQSREA